MALPARIGVHGLLLAALVAALPAPVKAEPGGALALPPHRHSLLRGDDWRWPQGDVRALGFLRLFGQTARNVAADLVAIPAGATTWSAHDWAGTLALSGGVAAFMVGPVPLDAQVQWETRRLFGHRDTRFQVWTQLGDALIFGSLGAAAVGTFLAGWYGHRPELVELVALLVEAFSVSELYHLGFKLLLGREGPKDGDGLGVIWGPTKALSLFPAGTPSGHAASVYALMGVLSAYWDNPWLTAGLQLFGLAFCGTMLIDDYHFVSDLVWGAALGWATGEWVVRHRSSRFHDVAQVPVRLMPVVEPRSGTVAVVLTAPF